MNIKENEVKSLKGDKAKGRISPPPAVKLVGS